MDFGGHTGQVGARTLGEAHTQLDADDGETTFEQWTGCLSSRAADLQEPGARP
jgi:hypothetical protein